jgi:ubiquinone/menaquinone biosynthesis C-methylase UbiE
LNAPERRNTPDIIVATVPLAGRTVVDIGCGEGMLVRHMARAGAHVVGVEPGPRMLEFAHSAPAAADERYIEAPAETLPLPDAYADLVVFSNSLHHVPVAAQPKALAEAARILKRGGTLYVSEPVADGPFFAMTRLFNDETEVRARALAALREATRHGLEPIDEFVHIQTVKSRDFSAFKERSIAIEPSRAGASAANEREIRAVFERNGVATEDGIAFDNPTRVNIFRRI